MNASNTTELMHTLGQQAQAASRHMARAGAATKVAALQGLARLLRSNLASLQAANELDLARARAAGLAEPMVDRLKLTPKVIETCALGCEQLAAMADMIGEISGLRQMPSGIRVGQMRVPIGVFGMIYESRPNVTIEAASLSIKSGNACILRGGSEAIDSNRALAALVQQALTDAGLPLEAVQLVPTTDRAAVGQLITMPQYVDVIIPRGGKGLIERISAEAKVPVIKHLDGNCHTYVDDPCDIAMAVKVADNAKTQKYSPCNATESLLVARGVAAEFLPKIGAIFAAKGVELEKALTGLNGAGVIDALLTQKNEPRKFSDKLAGIEQVRAAQELVMRVLAARSQHQAWLHHQRMARLTRVLLTTYADLKRERGWVDMNDVEGAARRLLADAERIRTAFGLLGDDESRQLFIDHVEWRLFLDYDLLPPAAPQSIYFDRYFSNENVDEVVYDIGAFNGDSVLGYLESGRPFREIHSFEPSSSNYQALVKTLQRLQGHGSFQAHQMAVGDACGEVLIEAQGGPAARVGSGSERVTVTTLDTLCGRIVPPTFIKIDIEGFEPQCLEGGRKLISERQPLIAVCVYHEQNHLWTILLQLHAYQPGYHFRLGPHLAEGWDLVLYAVPADRLPQHFTAE